MIKKIIRNISSATNSILDSSAFQILFQITPLPERAMNYELRYKILGVTPKFLHMVSQGSVNVFAGRFCLFIIYGQCLGTKCFHLSLIHI